MPRATAITGVSPALAPHLLQEARQQAAWLGLRHQEVATEELKDPHQQQPHRPLLCSNGSCIATWGPGRGGRGGAGA